MEYRVWSMEGKSSHARKVVQFLVPLSFFLPTAVSAAARTFQELVLQVVEIIDTATITLIVFALVAYFWGIATHIPEFGEEDGGEKRKGFFIWGILVLFVMVSIWGIIQILENTLFSDNSYNPTTGSPAVTLCDKFGNCS